MRLPSLKHLIESTVALSRCERVRVLGSSALLASFPDLGDAGQPLELSFDADLLIEPCDEQMAAMLHEAVGEGSLFAQRTGFHADFMRPEITETLSPGWNGRVVSLQMPGDIAALALVDLAVVKLRVGRPKDLELCQHLLKSGRITAPTIRERLDATPLSEASPEVATESGLNHPGGK